MQGLPQVRDQAKYQPNKQWKDEGRLLDGLLRAQMYDLQNR